MRSISRISYFNASLKTLNIWANFGLILVLCSKFYYLVGVFDGFKPSAPLPVILVRDLFVFGFLLLLGVQVRKEIVELKKFWALWMFGLLVSALLQEQFNSFFILSSGLWSLEERCPVSLSPYSQLALFGRRSYFLLSSLFWNSRNAAEWALW